MIVNEKLRNKLDWIQWASRDKVCVKSARKGHRDTDCTAKALNPEKEGCRFECNIGSNAG